MEWFAPQRKKIMKRSKRYKDVLSKIESDKEYPIDDALKLLQETAQVKFDAGIEVHIRLGIDPKKAEQVVRGSVVLLHGTGKTKKIAVFTENPEQQKKAKEAGAEIIGGKDLVDEIKKTNKTDFDIAIATPDFMKTLSAIARILGQKGLMPNPKTDTVAPDPVKVIEELKKGKVNFKNDKFGNLHQLIGKMSFGEEKLKENLMGFLDAVKKAKPEDKKGKYILGTTLCSSMGPGIKISVN